MNTFKRFVQLLAFTVVFCVVGLVGQSAHAATATIISGTLTHSDGTPVSGYTVWFGYDSGNHLQDFVTDTNGNYTVVYDTSLFNPPTPGLGLRFETILDGYISPDNYNFFYNGSSSLVENFTFVAATKTVNVTITDSSGTQHPQVDVQLAPLFSSPTDLSQSENCSGSCSLQSSVGGRYIIKADCNLSDTDATTCPFIATQTGQTVDFTNDDVVETKDITVVMADATRMVSLRILDSSGNSIYTGGFQADITFTGQNQDYGTVSTRRKIGTNGIVQVKLIPGVWTVSVSLTELGSGYSHQSFDPADMTFVLSNEPDPSQANADWGTVQAVNNVGSIAGTVTDNGIAVGQNVVLVATNLDTKARFTSNTVQAGAFAFDLLPYGKYLVTSSDAAYIPGQSQPVELTVANPAATGVSLTVHAIDITISGNLTDGSTTMTDQPAAVVAEAANGATFTAPVNADGSYVLNVASDVIGSATQLSLNVLTQPGADMFLPGAVTVAVTPDQDVTENLTVSTNEGTLSGQIVNPAGTNVTSTDFGTNAVVKAINVDNGSVEEDTIADDGSFSMNVGKGNWKVVPEFTDIAATAFSSNSGSESVTVKAGQDKTVDVSVQQSAGTVSGTATNPDGLPVGDAPIVFTNLPALQNDATANNTTVDPSAIVEVTTTTAPDGSYSQDLPKGDFTAYFMSNPDIDNLIEAPNQDFHIKQDTTTTVDAEYKSASAPVSGTITVPNSDSLESPSVIAYSPDGGTQDLTVDSTAGTFSGELSPGDWQIVVSGVTNDKLMVGQDTVTVPAAGKTFNPAVSDTGIDFPATVSTSGDVSDSIVLSNTAGAKVALPAYATGFAGDVYVELVPDPQIVFNNGIAQVGLAYDVNVTDTTTGLPVSQLNQPATVTLPIAPELVPTGGKDSSSWVASYYNSATQSNYTDGMVADTDGSKLVIQTDHFTRFSGITTVVSVPTKATHLKAKKIKTTAALLDWKAPIQSTVSSYTIQLRLAGDKKKKHWTTTTDVLTTLKKMKQLTTGVHYQFRVKTINTSGHSGYTKWKGFTTK